MKICVVGAGAIGGLVGVDLALAGEDADLHDRLLTPDGHAGGIQR